MRQSLFLPLTRQTAFPFHCHSRSRRALHTTMSASIKLKPAARVAGRRQDVWCVRTEPWPLTAEGLPTPPPRFSSAVPEDAADTR